MGNLVASVTTDGGSNMRKGIELMADMHHHREQDSMGFCKHSTERKKRYTVATASFSKRLRQEFFFGWVWEDCLGASVLGTAGWGLERMTTGKGGGYRTSSWQLVASERVSRYRGVSQL